MKGPNSWPLLINYKSLSCSEASQGESKEEDEKKKLGPRGCILFAPENWDNRTVFINVLFPVMIHDFT